MAICSCCEHGGTDDEHTIKQTTGRIHTYPCYVIRPRWRVRTPAQHTVDVQSGNDKHEHVGFSKGSFGSFSLIEYFAMRHVM